MSTEQDRITLAKAMGAIQFAGPHGGYFWVDVPNHGRTQPSSSKNWIPFDPFTDANDDVAVLEHFRNGDKQRYSDFKDAVFHFDPPIKPWMWLYTVGDYARAALKVLKCST